jgi:hypothetical protein
VKTRTLLASIAGSALVAVPVALAVDGQPLPKREGVVVAWQPRSTTAVVVTGDQRVYAIHTLRRATPGTRVRVEGIKWGTPTSGIKWTVAPSGIKWGIGRARNGSFQSRLTRLGAATTMSLRGTVVRRFGTRGVAVSIRGATFVIPLTRGAVWLPGGKRQNATAPLGQFGSTVSIQISFSRTGRASTRRLTELQPPVANRRVPISGRVIAVDAAAHTITIQAGTTVFPLPLLIDVPATVDLAAYPVGSQLAGLIVQAPAPQATLHAVELSRNETFGRADSPTTTIQVPVPNPAQVAASNGLLARWTAARAGGLIPNDGLFTSQRNRLQRVAFLIGVSDKAKAIDELENFGKRFKNVSSPDDIDASLRDAIVTEADALRSQLVQG